MKLSLHTLILIFVTVSGLSACGTPPVDNPAPLNQFDHTQKYKASQKLPPALLRPEFVSAEGVQGPVARVKISHHQRGYHQAQCHESQNVRYLWIHIPITINTINKYLEIKARGLL